MEYKDRRFRFITSDYTIKYVDKCPMIEGQEEGFNFGLYNPITHTIYICTKDDEGKPYPQLHLEQTLRHELIHLILQEGQYTAYCNEEPLVEWIAKALHILMDKGIFK